MLDTLSDKQVDDIVVLDMRPVSLLTDFFVIGTASNTRQMRAVIDAVAERVRDGADMRPVAREGEPDSGWVLIDFGDVIAHLFDAETRAFYGLESIWAKASLVVRMT